MLIHWPVFFLISKTVNVLDEYVVVVVCWMKANVLKPDPDKTEVLLEVSVANQGFRHYGWVYTPQQKPGSQLGSAV